MSDLPKNGDRYDWIVYRKLVLSKLDTIELDVSLLQEEQLKIRLDIRELKVRAAIWGGAAGGVLSLIGIVISLLFR